MKPLVRWTIGSLNNKDSFDCLERSIKSWKRLYGDLFDCVVCYNGIDSNRINLNIKKIDQKDFNFLCFDPKNTAWKIHPPRLRFDSHEIFIDNDLILYEKIPIIEDFLNSNEIIFCTEAYKRCYGQYDSFVNSHLKLNTGLFGLPPYFDFGEKIKEKCFFDWDNWFDEQGLLASIFVDHHDLRMIKLEEVWVCVDEMKMGKYGIHFGGLNRGERKYWFDFLKNSITLI